MRISGEVGWRLSRLSTDLSRQLVARTKVAGLFFCLCLLVQQPVWAQLAVEKVEPPNWWVGMQWSRVQLMVYGDDLDGLKASFTDARIRVVGTHFLESSHYAFIDVEIPANLPAGTYRLVLTKGGREELIDYPILAREAPAASHKGFGPEDVIYLIAPDRFANGNLTNDQVAGLGDFDPGDPSKRHGGDLEGIIGKLDYLRDLGITTLWLMPVLENSGEYSYHGYAATDLYQIDPRFGTNADYRRLVQEAHKRGLKVVYDHVANHIGIKHDWLSYLPAADWLNGSIDNHLNDKHFLAAVTDPYASPLLSEQMRTFWFVDGMPDLNQRNPFLANYLIQNTIWWMEYTGLDGLREDTYPYPDQAFMAEWAAAVLKEYPSANIVGEIWVNSPPYLAQFQKESKLARNFETNLPAVMDFPLCEAFRAYLQGKGLLRGIYDVLAQDFLYTDLDNLLVFMDNHDMSRGPFLAQGRTDLAKQVLTMLLTTRGIPQLLYGTEINMVAGESHAALRADFPGGFQNQGRNAFEATGRTTTENEVFSFLQKLLQIRKAHPALAGGDLSHQPPHWGYDVYTYWKTDGEEQFLVVINGHDEEKVATLPATDQVYGPKLVWDDLLTDTRFTTDLGQGIPVPARGVRLLRLNKL